jgi:hypothetical protein
MGLRLEWKVCGLAPAANLDVVIGPCAVGDARVGDVRNIRKQFVQAFFDDGDARVRLRDLLVERGDRGFEARRFGGAVGGTRNLLGQAVFLGLEAFGVCERRAPLDVERQDAIDE